MSLSEKDTALLEIAKKHAKASFNSERTSIAAALRSKKGIIYTGVNIKYHVRNISMCAETLAVCKAVEAGDTELDTIVGVKYFPDTDSYEVLTGCGDCRQIEAYHAPLKSIISVNGELKLVEIEDLLPFAFI